MNNDDVIWSIINNNFCSYLIKVKAGKFCRNPDNVTGVCNRKSCPLANSQYATVKEEKGIIYLYLKVAERAPYPDRLWEKIKLSASKEKAVEQIKLHMAYWNTWQRKRVLLRFNMLRNSIRIMRKLALTRTKKLVPLNKKVERRESRREAKALVAAQLETTIEKELLERLKKGTQDDIYNINTKAFEKALEAEEEEQSDEEEELSSDVDDDDEDVVYTSGSDLEEEEEDIEDMSQVQYEDDDEEMVLVPAGLPSTSRGARVTVEYDDEDEDGK